MSGHVENDNCSYRSIEDKPCQCIGIKEDILDAVGFSSVDDVEHHTDQNNTHTKSDGYDKYSI